MSPPDPSAAMMKRQQLMAAAPPQATDCGQLRLAATGRWRALAESRSCGSAKKQVDGLLCSESGLWAQGGVFTLPDTKRSLMAGDRRWLERRLYEVLRS